MTTPLPARKVCLLGDFAVGKTSLVTRTVRNTFSPEYLTTIGVKVDSKQVEAEGVALRMVLWDIAGTSQLDQLRASYLAGAHGLVLVADGTRAETVDSAMGLREQAQRIVGRALPTVLLLNKNDLANAWDLTLAATESLHAELPVHSTSANSGEGVEDAFTSLARMLA